MVQDISGLLRHINAKKAKDYPYIVTLLIRAVHSTYAPSSLTDCRLYG